MTGPSSPIADYIFRTKYAHNGESWHDLCKRVSTALADSDTHRSDLFTILHEQRFVPGGRILAAMGTTKSVTAMNCYTSEPIEDSMSGIMRAATRAAQTMRMGGGIGYDFSTIRPRRDPIVSLSSEASGPVSFMGIFDSICRTVCSAGHRRGAQMGVLRVDHPDIIEFIRAKHDPQMLKNFNLSVAVTSDFMRALESDSHYNLNFGGQVRGSLKAGDVWNEIMHSTYDFAEPGVLFIDRINKENNLYYCEKIAATNPCQPDFATLLTKNGEKKFWQVNIGDEIWSSEGWTKVLNKWSTGVKEVFCYRTENGGEFIGTLDHKVMENGVKKPVDFCNYIDTLYENGEIETRKIVSKEYLCTTEVFDITVDNKSHTYWTGGCNVSNCGEVPLQPNGACLLGSFNLTQYIDADSRSFDMIKFNRDIPTVVRAMDNVIDASLYPLPEQADEQKNKRRIGIGITGAANAIEMMGHHYGSPIFVNILSHIMEALCTGCYWASIDLAREKGSFPMLDKDAYLKSGFMRRLLASHPSIGQGIIRYGIRNSHLTSVAPTGTISMLCNNVSSGIEPVFDLSANRTIQAPEGKLKMLVQDYAYSKWNVKGRTTASVPVSDHVDVLCATQAFVDAAVSKTTNVPIDISMEDFKNVYLDAYIGGAKGCTTFRLGGQREGILEGAACTIDPATGQKSCG